MELAKRFEEATATTANTSTSINSLIMNRPYPIFHAKRVLHSLRDVDEKLVKIFLPKRYVNVVTDEDLGKNISRYFFVNLVYSGISELTRS